MWVLAYISSLYDEHICPCWKWYQFGDPPTNWEFSMEDQWLNIRKYHITPMADLDGRWPLLYHHWSVGLQVRLYFVCIISLYITGRGNCSRNVLPFWRRVKGNGHYKLLLKITVCNEQWRVNDAVFEKVVISHSINENKLRPESFNWKHTVQQVLFFFSQYSLATSMTNIE